EINYVDGVTSAVQTQLDAKQATVTGAASSIVTNNLDASRAVITAANGKVAVSDVTSAELGYVDGVTSAIQTQLDARQALDADLTDLADGTLTATKVENGTYFISSAGTSGKVWTSDGSGAGAWVTSTAASEMDGLSDVLVESSSMYIGNDPSSTTSNAEKNVAVGATALDAIAKGDYNVAVGYDALTALAGSSTNDADDNTALGYQAGDVITTGTNNVILGSGADPSANSAINQIVIGKGATGHGDNIAVIGNGSATAIHPHDDNEV
ncbi:uncharacterized protein METZ01_LOCUS428346, partial [marine metagenome]